MFNQFKSWSNVLLRSYAHNVKSFYEVLGLRPNASAAQIKAAYYKLSMMYHPDKCRDSDSASNMFRDIAEAYEVLGNIESKKIYDEQNSFGPRQRPISQENGPGIIKKRARPQFTGRTSTYNFDEYYKMHYGQALQRKADQKAAYDWHKEKLSNKDSTNSFVNAFSLIIVSTVVIFAINLLAPKIDKTYEPKKSKT